MCLLTNARSSPPDRFATRELSAWRVASAIRSAVSGDRRASSRAPSSKVIAWRNATDSRLPRRCSREFGGASAILETTSGDASSSRLNSSRASLSRSSRICAFGLTSPVNLLRQGRVRR